MSAVVNSGTASGGKGGTLSVTLGAAPTSGNILVCGVTEGTGVAFVSISNSMTRVAELDYNAGDLMWLYYKECDGTESATTTFTFAAAASATMFLGEYSGPSLFQVASGGTASGSGTAVTASTEGDADTTLNFVYSGVSATTGAYTSPLPAGYAIDRQINGGPTSCGFHLLAGASGSSPSITCPSGAWGSIHATFKDSPSGPPICLKTGDA